MKQFYLVLLVGLLACATTWQAAETSGLQQVQTIPLANVEGRIDHFSVDIQGKRLFVSALGSRIEYDNTQDNANHIHTVWRDFDNDFGVDRLLAHYATSPHHRNVRLTVGAR